MPTNEVGDGSEGFTEEMNVDALDGERDFAEYLEARTGQLESGKPFINPVPVSYTHLTLPTTERV